MIHNRFARFVLVGVFNTAFGYGLYLGLLELGLPIWAAWGGGLAVSLVVAFIMSGWLVFGVLHPSRFIWYVAAWGLIYVLNLGLIHELVTAGIDPRLAPIVVLPLNALLSFFMQKKFVFWPTNGFNPLRRKEFALDDGKRSPDGRIDEALSAHSSAPLRRLERS